MESILQWEGESDILLVWILWQLPLDISASDSFTGSSECVYVCQMWTVTITANIYSCNLYAYLWEWVVCGGIPLWIWVGNLHNDHKAQFIQDIIVFIPPYSYLKIGWDWLVIFVDSFRRIKSLKCCEGKGSRKGSLSSIDILSFYKAIRRKLLLCVKLMLL